MTKRTDNSTVDFLQIEEDDKILLLKFLHTLGGRMNILTAEEKKMEYLEVVFTDPNGEYLSKGYTNTKLT